MKELPKVWAILPQEDDKLWGEALKLIKENFYCPNYLLFDSHDIGYYGSNYDNENSVIYMDKPQLNASTHLITSSEFIDIMRKEDADDELVELMTLKEDMIQFLMKSVYRLTGRVNDKDSRINRQHTTIEAQKKRVVQLTGMYDDAARDKYAYQKRLSLIPVWVQKIFNAHDTGTV